jgi:signal transduction histidine kinase
MKSRSKKLTGLGLLMAKNSRSLVSAYGFAALSYGFAAAGTALFWEPFFKYVPFALFFAALSITAWFAGFWPGGLVALLGAITTSYLMSSPGDVVLAAPSALFVIACFMCYLIEDRSRRLRTENAELERRVRERTAQLEAVNKELESFCYSVSHDLRAPLRAIDGFSMILQESYGDKLDVQAHKYLERVRAATQRMGHLIDDLLKLSRTARSEMRITTVNLSELVCTIAKDLEETAPKRKVTFSIAPDMIVNADANLMRVVLENLLGNAWKFSGKRVEARIGIGSTTNAGKTAYFVRDNGAGFDMKHADKLFGAFQRLHSVTAFDGTGVGLANVQRIILRHGGRVWAEAAVDQGATFYFTLSA